MTEDTPDIAGLNEPDGATVILSHPEVAIGVTGPGGTVTGFRISLDGPVMRFLVNGHL